MPGKHRLRYHPRVIRLRIPRGTIMSPRLRFWLTSLDALNWLAPWCRHSRLFDRAWLWRLQRASDATDWGGAQ